MDNILRTRSLSLLERHVHKLVIHGQRATGLCPFHPDRHPSFSADLERSIWHCFPCSRGGGVKDFAVLVGEKWDNAPSKIRFARGQRARLQAEQQARAILQQRKDERCAELFLKFCELWREAANSDYVVEPEKGRKSSVGGATAAKGWARIARKWTERRKSW
jgi:CHC2-type zinc finger protein